MACRHLPGGCGGKAAAAQRAQSSAKNAPSKALQRPPEKPATNPWSLPEDAGACAALFENGLGECSRPRVSSLSECVNLAPPWTGSRTLAEALAPLSSHPRHNHSATLGQLSAQGRRCFVITVRDPAPRLVSGVSNLQNAHRKAVTPWRATANDFVDALRNASHPRHALALGHDAKHVQSFMAGFTLFFPTTCDFYLRGLDCARHEVHFVCTERLWQDFDALRASMRLRSNASSRRRRLGAAPRAFDPTEFLKRGVNGSDASGRPQIRSVAAPRERLSDDNAEYVRRRLYPADARLAEMVCGREERRSEVAV